MSNLSRLIRRFMGIFLLTVLTLVSCNSFVSVSNIPSPSLPTANPALTSSSTVDSKDKDADLIPDAPYIQTPTEVVLKMLEMAKVSTADQVYDLGSGDGRIVIAAAQNFGANAVGIEIDPELMRESDRSSKEAIAKTPEISDRLKFIRQDLFKADLSQATVITLYLLPKANLRVRSEILPKLKSGTRVVSHDYDFGDLSPQQVQEVKVGDRAHKIYLWVVN
ncbi:SAM-dependent methyltransferase [Pseudanabaena sp. FACHB-1998]|uniref:methyltransferase domain-containing protein n=1 Tax=Pseudanabaena sp. FACHB-1998 TaxID=2692858 RepID=UPI0016805719|nr:methyltransferase domain-containing protein [Pseudanabaena sp. FACHB-1998]MBD2178245.1 SAM-dependent methyltransferase [Pseudanabaena sp. FACHB-1998]